MIKKLNRGTYPVFILILVLMLSMQSLNNFELWGFVSGDDVLKATGTVTGSDPGDNFGWNVTGLGDVNGDGFDDILVGAPKTDVNPKRWWDEDWANRMKLIFNNSGQLETLINFPVLVTLDSSKFNYSRAKPDGSDLRFIDGVKELKYHIEKWNTLGESFVWVNVISIDAGSSSDFIWMYYGNPKAANTQDESGTYDANFMGVWHLNEALGIHYDSTVNNNDGVPQGGVTQDATGKIAGADDFDGDTDYIDVGTSSSLNIRTSITIEAWAKPDGIDHTYNDLSVVSKFDNSDRAYQLGFNDDSGDSDDWDFRLSSDGSSTNAQNHVSNSVTSNEWQYVTGTWDGTDVRLYKNGGEIGTAVSFPGPIYLSTADVWIGDGTYYGSMDGWIDEVRISNNARSADWIAASYLSMNNNFITYIPEEQNTWWNSNWEFRKSLIFDNSGQADTLINFPVLVTLDTSNFDYIKAKADGTDLRFIEGTKELKYHIEKWNTSGESFVWINVSSISAGSSSDYIWMYYGNPQAANTQDVSGTYDVNYTGVWHLNESSGTPFDATSYKNDGTIYNGVLMNAPGKVDGAADFEGGGADDDYIDCGNDPSLEFDASKDYTWSAWIYRHVNSDWDVIFSKFSWTNYGIRVFVNTGGAPNIVVGNHQNEFVTSLGTISLNTWYYISVVYNSSLPMLPGIFINGERQGTIGVATFLSDSTTPFEIGYGVDPEGWDGGIDEVRFSNKARSDSWVKAQYLSMNNSFITFGEEETLLYDAGAAYLFFGYPQMSLTDISADSANVTIYGSSQEELFGWSVSSAGDQNGDSYDDFIIGAPGYKNHTGRAYIFYGRDTSSWRSVMWADSDADIILTGENEGDRFGHSVSEVGDVNRENDFDSWMFRKTITIVSSQVAGDLTDFPVLFQTIDPDLANGARPDGYDIVFTADDGMTLLDFEIESYNQSSGALVAWIKIPFLSSTKNTEIFMYYGNPSSFDLSNADGVWDSDYMGVWHLSESGDGTAGEFIDSSIYDNNGQGGSGTVNQVPSQTSGKIGYGQIFDGVDDHINSGYDTSLDIGGTQITLEAWINYSGYNPANYMGIMAHDGWTEGYRLAIRDNGDPLYFHLPEDASWVGASQVTPLDSWVHVVGVYNGSTMKIFINGAQDTNIQAKSNNIEISPNEFWIGHGDNEVGQSYSYPWDGMVDEVRVSSIARSSDWIVTEYNNQHNTSSFFAISPEEVIASNWLYRKQIIIDSAEVAKDLSDFPVLIKTVDLDLKNHARPDGFDIIFTLADGKTKLAHEIEMYNGLSGELIAWVKIPNLSSTTDTIIFMHYGNPLSFNQQDIRGTWSNGYLGVYHMDEGTGNINNSASSFYNGARVNTPTRINAQIGYGQEFTGSGAGDMFDVGNLGFSDGVKENITVSVWANINDSALDIWSRIINKRDDSDSNTLWGVHFDSQPTDKDLVFAAAGDTGAWPIAKSTWMYITMTYDGLLKTHYHNGAFMRDDTGGSGPISISSSAPVTIGARQGPTQDFGGVLDEMRISFVSRSAEWVLTQYNNQNDPGSFCTFGEEEIKPENWFYYKPVTIYSSMVTEDLNDFPVLVDITDLDLKDKARSDGYDIVFTDVDGITRLDHEMESYDNTTGRILAWVRIPYLSSTSNTKIYMHYGNPNANLPPNEEGVWKNGYVGVYHMVEDTGNINNSAFTSNDGTRVNTPTRTPAQIGYGQEFTGSGANDMFDIGDLGLSDGVWENLTLSFWMHVNNSETEDYGRIISKRNDANTASIWGATFTNDPFDKDLSFEAGGDSGAYPVAKDVWVYVTYTYDGANKIHYLDGSWVRDDTGGTGPISIPSSSPVTIGARQGLTQNFGGILDEMRFSKVARSAGWIETEFNNQNDPGAFLNVGSEDMNFQGWSYRKPLIIHSQKVTGDLTNFPVLVSITDPDLKNHARPDGYDIVFTSTDGRTRLDFEVENYTSALGKLVAWVRVPNLSSTTDTKIDMYFGKSTQSTTMENPHGVWDSNYLAVWHLNENGDGTLDEYDESTTSDYDGWGGSGDVNKVPTWISAKIDSGQEFDGIDDHINVNSQNPQAYDDFTIEAWFRSSGTSVSDDEYIWSHIEEYAAGPGIIFSVTDDPSYGDRLRLNCYNDALDYSPYYGVSDIVDQQYHYVVGVRGGGDIKLYVDANQENKTPEDHLGQTYNVDNSSSPNIGDLPGQSEQVGGILDEIRISNAPRSWDWINATYNNQNDPSTFITLGSKQDAGGFDDVIVGAPGFSNEKGRAYIFFGNPSLSGEFPANSADVIINGSLNGDRLGQVVSGKGNIDANGYDDIIISAPGAFGNDGAVYVVFGVDSMPVFLEAVNSDIIILGSGGYELGSSISGSVDVNADGFDDIIVGSPKNNGGTGAAFVFYGTGSMEASMNIMDADLMMFGEFAGDGFGYSIEGIKDINGDGIVDLAIGAPNYDDGVKSNSGAIYIFQGGIPMDGISDWIIKGEYANDHFGWTNSYAGNICGDTINYIIAGAPHNDEGGLDSGKVYIITTSYKPLISNVMASPISQLVGGNVNISCTVTSSLGVNFVWANITLPNGSFLNRSMDTGIGDNWYLDDVYDQIGMYQFVIWANNTLSDWSQSTIFQFNIINQVPTLTIAQVDPITGYIDSSFNFTVIFTDPDDQPPDAITVNITGFGAYDLLQSDPLDTDYSDGKEYYFDLAGFSIGQYPFHFAANDSTGYWVESGTFLFDVINRAPTLTISQVDPNSGDIDSSFNYTVIFTDPDDQPPDTITVNITGFGQYDLLQSDPLDTDYSDGKIYYLELAGFSIGQYSFHFAANDSTGYWVESGDLLFDVINRAPTLSSAFVTPASGYNDDSYNFSVIYTDLDDHAPGKITVNISGAGSFDLLQSDPSDNNFIDGKSYYYVVAGYAQNQYQFNFAANDSFGEWVETSSLQFDVLNRAPTLSFETVNPTTGYTQDKFNFTVTYFDQDNNAPDIICVNITNFGVYALFEVNVSDTDFTDGKEYYFNNSLAYGSYSFHFAANDIFGWWAFETPEILFPEVSPRPGVLDILDLTIEYSDIVFLNATLIDNQGNPIADENISFYIDLDSDGLYEPLELVGTGTISPSGQISLSYNGEITSGSYNYSAEYVGSGGYIISEDYASLTVLPKPATLTASIITVESGQRAFLNATLIDSSNNPIMNEYVELYLDRNRNGDYDGSEFIVSVPTSVSGLASIEYQINLDPENYGLWAKYEGSANYIVTEIKGLITVMVTGNIPPTIIGTIPHQIKPEDSTPWSISLTPYEDDIEDFGLDLKWYLEGVNTSLYTVTGENSTNDVLTFIPKPDAFGSDEVTLWLVDSGGNWDMQTLWVNLTPVNDIPYFDPLPPDLFVRYDDPSDPDDNPAPWDYTYYVHDVETSSDNLVLITSEPVSDSGDGYAEVNGLEVSFHYPKDRVGEAILVFLTLSDGTDSVQNMIVVNVTSDWVPELTDNLPDIVITENSTIYNVFDLDDFFSDRDKDIIFFSSGNDNIIVNINQNNTVDITAPPQWSGKEFVTFRARDPTGAIVEDFILVTVLPVNDGPVISGVPDLVVHYDYSYSFDLSPYIHDPDNQTWELTIWTSESTQYIDALPNNNLGMSINYPEILDGSTIPVTIYVSDGLAISSLTINVSVTPYFPPELVVNLPDVHFNEDSTLEKAFVLSNYFFDVDSNILFYTEGAVNINITINSDLSVDFSAPENWFGYEVVTFRATDPNGALAEDKIQVYVVPVNDAPTIELVPRQDKQAGDQWVVDLTEFIDDVDNDLSELTIIVESDSNQGYVTIVGHVLIFQYPAGVNEDYVSITVSDGELETRTGFIVSIKENRQLAPSIWDLIPWPWVLSTIFVSLVGAMVVYRKMTRYKVYEAFLIHEKGLSVGHASLIDRSELEEVIVSGMFTAVQDFIGDTFSDKTSEDWELDEMKFGENKILIERSKKLFLALVFEGNGNTLRIRVKKLLGDINQDYGNLFEDWKGDMYEVRGINPILMGIISKKRAKRKEREQSPAKPKPKPLKIEPEPIELQKEHIQIKADPNLTELNEIINWSKEQTKIENITGKAEMGYLNEDNDLTESLECPICGIEVNEGTVFCPNCKAKFSKPKE